MKTKPTEKEIKAEIQKLREMKPTVLKLSVFGDNHHDAIDAQIEVLNNLGEFFDEEEIDRLAGENEKGWSETVRGSAIEAFRWVEGEAEDGPPSEGWQSLVRK